MPKRRRTLFLVLLLLILSIGAGNYGGYCTNRWGQQTLLLQYLFAPYCPASSQAARYAPFEVLVPAASDPYFLAISPSGRFVLYAEQQPKYQGVLINIENGQRTTINIPNVTWAFFLNDTLLVAPQQRSAINLDSFVLVHVNSGINYRVPYKYVGELPMVDESMLQKIRQAEQVFVQSGTSVLRHTVIVAINATEDYNPDMSIMLAIDGFSDFFNVLNLLRDEGINYQLVQPPYRYSENRNQLQTASGRRWADRRGIGDMVSNRLLAATGPYAAGAVGTPPRFNPIAFGLNDEIAIYRAAPQYVINISGGGNIFPRIQLFPVPQPLLLLRAAP